MTTDATRNNGGPAFPETGSRGKAASGEGMSLRDWFAGQALAGVILHPNMTNGSPCEIAGMAYQIADALLLDGATHE